MTKEYGYTNSYDEYVVVAQDHIDTAIEIYQELSKASRSKKVSWKKHKRMMETEGYDDSDTNENYRQLIKRTRKEIGVLPSVEKHADMLASGKLASIREELGAIQSSRLEANDEYTRLAKLKREWNRELLIVEGVQEAIYNVDLSDYAVTEYEPMAQNIKSDKELFVTLNDIHYGYEVEGYYSTEIAKKIINEYADKIIDLGLKEGIKKVIIGNLGDNIEGRLRRQSLVDSSLSHVQQAVDVAHVIASFIKKLSKFFDIEIFFIVGNHSRLSESYKDSIEGESVVPIIENIVDAIFSDNDNVQLIKPLSSYYHILDVKGYNIFACHGDRHKLKDNNLLNKLSTNYDTMLDVVIGGHFHSHAITEVAKDKYQIITGSIKGIDSFSEKINAMSGRSQVAIIFDDSGFDIRQIKL